MPFYPADCISTTPPVCGSYGVYVYPIGGGGTPIDVNFALKAGMQGSFGSLITSQEQTSVHLSFPYCANSSLIEATGAFGGYVTASDGKLHLHTTTSSSGSAYMESINAVRYIAGIGARVKFAGYFTNGADQSYQEIGIGDDLDGYFFGYSGSQFGVNRRRDGTDNWVFQSSWNRDVMDGSGLSGITLAPVSGNVYMISYQWLGFGAIKFAIARPETGEFYDAHVIEYSNQNTIPSILNPTLPLRMAVRNWGNTTDVSTQVSSMGGFTEAGSNVDHPSPAFSFENDKNNVTTEVSVFAIRNKPEFFGKRNRTRAHLDIISIANRSNSFTKHRVLLNPVLGGTPSYTDLSGSVSVIQTDTAGTTVTGGRSILHLQLSPSSGEVIKLKDLNYKIKPNDILVITASGSNADVAASLTWNEEF